MALRDRVNPRELLYPSNLLTLSRLLLLPTTLHFLGRPERRRAALACLALTMFTDAVDGPIARWRGEVSQLGELLDPVADKLVLDTTAVMLSRTYGFPWPVTGLLIFRDVGILLSALVVISCRSSVTTAQSSGKATTVALTAAALCYVADGPRSGRPALALAMLPFGLSFVQYGARFIRLMRDA
ncbi:CDP-alcohol phosphatidyltransferase family protein [Oscillochloris sp. ZM17-4]|uniref:CDP-alcohol phosphatidyltransferase family protein n=1 Tax=Oscillochloris sp. ZM17-4 TaxID=2866714 RepID=UPI001C729F1C|nr:CDP-alcohol phosphatidyltransferase family protein [Oscillochloris sp. ZM17-4]MBX0330393.1 CDP-alcohol phosphatidyltransferase family protein [Oscillochloris sp. ZM17-4]